jgi:hypothetical protein
MTVGRLLASLAWAIIVASLVLACWLIGWSIATVVILVTVWLAVLLWAIIYLVTK